VKKMLDIFIQNIIDTEITKLEYLKKAIESDDKQQAIRLVDELIAKMNVIKTVVSKIKLSDASVVTALKKLVL